MVNAAWVRKALRPYVSVSAVSTAQSITNGFVYVNVALNTEESDTDGAFASNTFTVPAGCSGLYACYATISYGSSCSSIGLAIAVGGTPVRSNFGINSAVCGFDLVSTHQFNTVVNLTAGNAVTLQTYQVNIAAGSKGVTTATLTIYRLGNL
jgi:hypothetical protein